MEADLFLSKLTLCSDLLFSFSGLDIQLKMLLHQEWAAHALLTLLSCRISPPMFLLSPLGYFWVLTVYFLGFSEELLPLLTLCRGIYFDEETHSLIPRANCDQSVAFGTVICRQLLPLLGGSSHLETSHTQLSKSTKWVMHGYAIWGFPEVGVG